MHTVSELAGRSLDELGRNLRDAVRFLRRTPAFTIPAVASLALGISVNTTMFSVFDSLIVKPLDTRDASGVVRIGRTVRGQQDFRSVEYEELVFLREHASSFSGLAGESMDALLLGGPDGARPVGTEFVIGDYFDVLGRPPALGRGFTEDEERAPGAGPVAVISDRMWRRSFGGDPAVLGTTVPINNVPITIVGVAPPGFVGTFPGVDIELWLPLGMTDVVKHRPARSSLPTVGVFGRLRPGVSIAAARAELDVIARRMAEEDPSRDANRAFSIASARGVHPAFAQPLRLFMLLLMASLGVVLLIACANVASLLLARAGSRRRELAVRLALGASRRRVVSQLLVESLVLAALGGAGGLVLSLWPVHLLGLLALPGPGGARTFFDVSLDGRVLAFTAALSMLTAVAFGLVPALRATRLDIVPALKDSSRWIGARRSVLRGALAVAQVAFSFVLLVAAALVFRSLLNSGTRDVGLDPDGVVVASFDLQALGYDGSRMRAFQGELLARARALPGIEGAALASFAGHASPLAIPNIERPEQGEQLAVRIASVSDGYFATVRQPILRGRGFAPHEANEATRIAIVNEAMARRFWPAGDPLGERIGVGEDLAEHVVIGVAGDARRGFVGGEPEPLVYVPAISAGGVLHVRAPAPASGVLADLRRAVQTVDPALAPYLSGRTLRQDMASSLLPAQITQVVLGVAGGIALLLAAGGLYGLVSYTVQQRLREVGIRVALGATSRNVFGMMVGGAVRLTAIGVVLGVVAGAAATRLLGGMLFGVSPTDPLTFGAIAVVLMLVTLGAGYAAARRGLDVDPGSVLRAE